MNSQRFCAASECGHQVLIHDENGKCGWRGCQCKRMTVGLSKRELQVLLEIAAGHSYKKAARSLGITRRTIDCHMVNVARRTRASGRFRIILCAIRAGIIPIESLPSFVPLVQVKGMDAD